MFAERHLTVCWLSPVTGQRVFEEVTRLERADLFCLLNKHNPIAVLPFIAGAIAGQDENS